MKGGEIMRDSLHVKIMTPDRIFFEGESESVTVKTGGGDRQILLNRRPFSSKINPGIVKLKIDGKEKKLATAGGFIKPTKNTRDFSHEMNWLE